MTRVRDVDVANKLNEQFRKSGLKSFNEFINQILEDYVNRGYYFNEIYDKVLIADECMNAMLDMVNKIQRDIDRQYNS
ncbi:MAG TPA: hypothetical protein IAC38_02415 [Candidatus Caccovivens faecavium]|nr:hypothetical protein [Candidatus Caccovivens faecavium]